VQLVPDTGHTPTLTLTGPDVYVQVPPGDGVPLSNDARQ